MSEARRLMPTRMAHRAAFVRSWLRDPMGIAAIAPSGRMLAKLMAHGLDGNCTVVELGAGTGALTRAIRSAGVVDQRLHLVERDERLAALLRERFPEVSVHCIDAEGLTDELDHLVGSVDCIVSGLPILCFSRPKKRAVLEGAFSLLRPRGFYQQFTYFGRPPVGARLLGELGLAASRVGIAPLNLPPAFVYRFSAVDSRAL